MRSTTSIGGATPPGRAFGGDFEQNFHVAHRLDRYRAGRRMDFEQATSEVIARAIAEEIAGEVDYLPVETDGAKRAAELIGDSCEALRQGASASLAAAG